VLIAAKKLGVRLRPELRVRPADFSASA
jgi:hypothetical protein